MFEKYAMIAMYFGVPVVLGWLAARRIRNMSDFVVGRKRLGYWVAAVKCGNLLPRLSWA